ncbi:hypothetical protein AVEN_53416-1 [Araneus ventricosus]|uniref:Uncharacterized protein n=1 Tax=Araneus ventricosus TaxID=182803 RepID=A0A4Y2AAE7_ARAVE|nr:hypothetical protein AVEN_53416-1 [Araneus ventricosus]
MCSSCHAVKLDVGMRRIIPKTRQHPANAGRRIPCSRGEDIALRARGVKDRVHEAKNQLTLCWKSTDKFQAKAYADNIGQATLRSSQKTSDHNTIVI